MYEIRDKYPEDLPSGGLNGSIDTDSKTNAGIHFHEISLEASDENLDAVLQFVDEQLEHAGCPIEAQRQIDIAVEEIFVNIVSYAYIPDTGNATVRLEISGDLSEVTLIFMDQGIPFNPLAKEDPDIDLPANQRRIGGLGILVVKEFMDDVSYEYKDRQNILTLKKIINHEK